MGPLLGVVGDVVGDVFVGCLIADDVFVVIALPDGMGWVLAGKGGFETSDEGGERSGFHLEMGIYGWIYGGIYRWVGESLASRVNAIDPYGMVGWWVDLDDRMEMVGHNDPIAKDNFLTNLGGFLPFLGDELA